MLLKSAVNQTQIKLFIDKLSDADNMYIRE